MGIFDSDYSWYSDVIIEDYGTKEIIYYSGTPKTVIYDLNIVAVPVKGCEHIMITYDIVKKYYNTIYVDYSSRKETKDYELARKLKKTIFGWKALV